MAIIVEDGTGLSNAESYISVADAGAYLTAHGKSQWNDFGTDDQEPALRRATEWIDMTFRNNFVGYRRFFRNQALEWPRMGAYVNYADNAMIPQYVNYTALSVLLANDIVPPELQRATAEAAVRELVTPFMFFPDVTPGKIIHSVSVAGAISVDYSDTTVNAQNPRAQIIAYILQPLLITSGPSSLFGSSDRI